MHGGLLFHEAIRAGRQPENVLDNIFEDNDQEDPSQDQRKGRAGKGLPCAVTVSIGGHKLCAVNSEKKIALRLDGETIAFIADCMVPMMRQVIGKRGNGDNSSTANQRPQRHCIDIHRCS